MKKLKILLACEESQAVTKEFRRLGHEAYSCDILPCSGGHPEWHLQQDVVPLLEQKWDLIIAFPPCFDKETLITTKEGLKKIEDIQVGDLVLTHLGRYRKVTEKMVRMSPSYRILKSSNNIETKTTDEHPYFVRKREKREDMPAEFVECKDLDKSYFTGSVFSKESVARDYDDEMLYLMGRYVADGHLRKSRTSENEFEEMMLSIGSEKLEDFKDNVKNKKYNIYREKNVYKVSFYSRSFCNLFEQFGKGAENKTIPQWVVDLPTEQLKVFLKGYLSGDGHISKNRISCTTISKKLAIQIGLVISKVYEKPYSIFKAKERDVKIEGRDVHCKPLYTVFITINPSKKQNYFSEGYSWGKVLKNEKILEELEVHNISVEEDESYIANGVIVHNCTFLTVTGNRWFNVEKYGQKAIQRHKDREEAIQFFKMFAEADCEHIAIENPVGIMSSEWRKPNQIINPYQFGDPFEKKTCLWLKGLPLLEPTDIVTPPKRTEFASGKSMPSWYAEAWKLPKEERAKLRSKTFPGIAKAIAEQWSEFLIDSKKY